MGGSIGKGRYVFPFFLTSSVEASSDDDAGHAKRHKVEIENTTAIPYDVRVNSKIVSDAGSYVFEQNSDPHWVAEFEALSRAKRERKQAIECKSGGLKIVVATDALNYKRAHWRAWDEASIVPLLEVSSE